jgi:hypothetical protein
VQIKYQNITIVWTEVFLDYKNISIIIIQQYHAIVYRAYPVVILKYGIMHYLSTHGSDFSRYVRISPSNVPTFADNTS